MVITNFIEYLFYDETPACILFGFEVTDEQTCEEITKAFDALFYMSFIMALTTMLLKITKLLMMFLKVVEYLFIVKFFEDSMANNSRNRSFLLLMSKLELWNESFYGICGRRPCKHKLIKCFACNHNSNSDIIKNNNNLVSNLFTILFNRFKSQLRDSSLEKNMKDIKLIFMNDKYCNKDNKNKSNFQLKQYKNKRSLNICTDSSATTTMNSDHENKHDSALVIKDGEKLESPETIQNGTSLNDLNVSISEPKNCVDIEKEKGKNYLRCKNKYVHRIFRLMPVPVYPMLLLEKNHMRIVVKKYNNVNNFNSMKINELNSKRRSKPTNYKKFDPIEVKERQASINTISTTSSLLYSNTVTSSIKSNETYLIDKPSSVVKKIVAPVKAKVSIKSNEVKLANKTIKLEEIKRKNLLRYIESLNSNRKYKSTHVQQEKLKMNILNSNQNKIKSCNINYYNDSIQVSKNNCPKTKSKKPFPVRTTDLKLENNSLNVIKDYSIEKSNYFDNDTGVAVTRLQSLQLSIARNKNKITDVREDIVNTLVNLPKDTLTTMRYRYKLHKSNKNRNPTSNNSLDVIHENSSRSNDTVDTDEKVEM